MSCLRFLQTSTSPVGAGTVVLFRGVDRQEQQTVVLSGGELERPGKTRTAPCSEDRPPKRLKPGNEGTTSQVSTSQGTDRCREVERVLELVHQHIDGEDDSIGGRIPNISLGIRLQAEEVVEDVQMKRHRTFAATGQSSLDGEWSGTSPVRTRTFSLLFGTRGRKHRRYSLLPLTGDMLPSSLRSGNAAHALEAGCETTGEAPPRL
jgi:hypothetical protein